MASHAGRKDKIKTSLTERQATLERLRRHPEVSVLIVGGGINGAGLFRDLALQGIDVVLIDKSDFCLGGQRRPIAHDSRRPAISGVRRIPPGPRGAEGPQPAVEECGPLRSPAADRDSDLRMVLRRVELHRTFPAHRQQPSGPSRRGAGENGADVLRHLHDGKPAHDRLTSSCRARSRWRCGRLLNPNLLKTATYYDAWISYPERLCVELLLDGEDLWPQANAINYVSLQGGSGTTVTVRDECTGEVIEVRPKVLVNATGAWIDFTNRALGCTTRMISGTKGAHLVVDNPKLMESLRGEMIYYETADGRVSIALPWLGKALIGSTDIRVDDPDKVRCEDDEIDYMLESIRQVLPDLKIERSEIVSTFLRRATSALRRGQGHGATQPRPSL